MALSILRRGWISLLSPRIGSCRLCSKRGADAENADIEPADYSFDQLRLSEDLNKRLSGLGFHSMFDIQAKTLPLSLAGRDIVGRAETGSGKTLCFVLPIVEALSESAQIRQPRALAILPTRELCHQVTKSVELLAPHLTVVSCFGGEDREIQRPKLAKLDIVLGTPGRLSDFLKSGDLRLDKVKFVALDEADELLSESFISQIEDILRRIPVTKQTMMFSATMPYAARLVAKRFMHDPVYIDLTSAMKRVPSSVQHYAMPVDEGREVACIMHILEAFPSSRTLVFVGSKASARALGKYLNKSGVVCQSLHGDMDQALRLLTLDSFMSGELSILVSTDVAARGLDIPDLEVVVQVGASPNGAEFYIHRSGRTGRAGRPGSNIILCYQTDGPFIQELGHHVTITSLAPPKHDLEKAKTHPWAGSVLGLGLGPRALSSQFFGAKSSHSKVRGRMTPKPLHKEEVVPKHHRSSKRPRSR